MATYAVEHEPTQLKSVGNSESAVSWSAVLGGAAVAAALSVLLIALGSGLGLSAISPWSNTSASIVGAVGIGWLIFTEVIASAMGGYLAGRLRTKWVSVQDDEIYFRDTAHGFLVWAVGVIISASLLGSAALTMTGSAAADSRNASEKPSTSNYFVDTLLRSDHPGSPADSQTRAEIETILTHSLTRNNIPASDRNFLTSLVVAETDLTPADAQNRVDHVIADMRLAADNARKATAHLLLWTFLALLIGAFCASLAATFGGKQRDAVKMPTL